MPYYQLGAFSGGESFLFLLFCTAGFKFNCFRNWYGARIMRMWFQESRWGRVGRCMKTQIILVFERSFFIGPQTQSFLPLTLPQISQGPLCLQFPNSSHTSSGMRAEAAIMRKYLCIKMFMYCTLFSNESWNPGLQKTGIGCIGGVSHIPLLKTISLCW